MCAEGISLRFGIVLPLLIISSICLASGKPALPDQAHKGLETALGSLSEGPCEGIGEVVLEWMLNDDPSLDLVGTIHESLGLIVPPGLNDDWPIIGLESAPLFGDGNGIGSYIHDLLDEDLRGRELAQAIHDSLGVGGPPFDPHHGRPDEVPPHFGNEIPKPATLSLLGLGAALMFRRRLK